MNEHQNTEKQEALDRKGFYIDVGTEIRERRKLLGITQEELAERIGKSPMHLRNLENARRQSLLHVYVDIAKALGQMKKQNQVMVGFALETNDEENHAKEKLQKKNLDFIVLNSLQDEGAGFQHNTNKVTFIDKDGKTRFPLKSKRDVAKDIVNKLVTIIK